MGGRPATPPVPTRGANGPAHRAVESACEIAPSTRGNKRPNRTDRSTPLHARVAPRRAHASRHSAARTPAPSAPHPASADSANGTDPRSPAPSSPPADSTAARSALPDPSWLSPERPDRAPRRQDADDHFAPKSARYESPADHEPRRAPAARQGRHGTPADSHSPAPSASSRGPDTASRAEAAAHA